MITVEGQVNFSYTIEKTNNLFSLENDVLLNIGGSQQGCRRFILIDKQVHTLYGKLMEQYFANKGIETKVCVIDAGDYNKNEENFLSVFKELCLFDSMRRSEPLLAIGGGVVTDLGGFVASTYRRGIPHVKVPTTLMGYVDASVGIKTGINFGPYKNRMGTFEIPGGVILDKTFLKTLDRRNIVNGIGEILKLAVILDPVMFDMLEQAGNTLVTNKFQSSLGDEILDRSIQGMVNELCDNLFEANLKRKVDFGHTFSLAIESGSDYDVMHGEAVAIDVLFSCCIAYLRGLLKERDLERVFSLYQTLDAPTWSPYLTADRLWEGVKERVMHRDGQQLIPIPTGIGQCTFINDLRRNEIASAIDILANFVNALAA